MGDESIRLVAGCLEEEFPDALCIGRLGGDEFGLLLRTQESFDAAQSFGSVQRQLAAVEVGDESGCRVTVSTGIAIANVPTTARRLLTEADKALYLAKSDGRDTYRVVRIL